MIRKQNNNVSLGYTFLYYEIAFIWCLVNSYDADRRGERGFHMIISGTFSVIGYILIIALSSVSDVAKYIGVVIATIGGELKTNFYVTIDRYYNMTKFTNETIYKLLQLLDS